MSSLRTWRIIALITVLGITQIAFWAIAITQGLRPIEWAAVVTIYALVANEHRRIRRHTREQARCVSPFVVNDT